MPLDFDVGDGADALTRDQLVSALDGTYWVSGWDWSLGAGDLEVDIAAGDGAINGGDVSTASTQTIDFTGDPDPTNPRKAAISVDSGGNVVKTLGLPAPADPTNEVRFRTWDPQPPAESVPGVVVAEVWLDAGETVLETTDVRDRRVANTSASRPSLALLTQTISEDTFNAVETVSFDFTPNTEDVYLNQLALTFRETATYTIEIEKNSTVVASKDVAASAFSDEIITFSQSDYSELLSPGDTGTVSIIGGDTESGPSGSSYSGVLVDISSQTIQRADFNGYALLFAKVLDV